MAKDTVSPITELPGMTSEDATDLLGHATMSLRRALESIGCDLRDHWSELSCRDVWNLYQGCLNTVGDVTGSRANFSGLSEFLVARALDGMLGSRDYSLLKVAAKRGKGIRLARPILRANGTPQRSVHPDISLWRADVAAGDALVGVVEVKVTVSQRAALDDELARLSALHEGNCALKGMLVVFNGPSATGKGWLDGLAESRRPWFSVAILQNDTARFHRRLAESLGLAKTM